MAYSQFTLSKVKEDFNLTTVEGTRFFPANIEAIAPSTRLLANKGKEKPGFLKKPGF